MHDYEIMNRRLLIACLLFLTSVKAQADLGPYRDEYEVSVKIGQLTFHHMHDWSSPKLAELSITRKKEGLVLSMRSPTGKRMTIPIGQ
jgi:hypothetical protein